MSEAVEAAGRQGEAGEPEEESIGGMPTELLHGTPPYVPRGEDRIVSSGIAPTGGVPVGGATDRVQPDRTIPRTAENVEPHRDPSGGSP
jgi:hypothetical protein